MLCVDLSCGICWRETTQKFGRLEARKTWPHWREPCRQRRAPNSQSNVPFCFLKRESLPHLIIVHPKRRRYVKKYIDLKSIWEPSPLIHKRRRSTPRKKIEKICVISQRGCVCVSSTRGFLSATEGLCFYSCFYTAIFVCVSSFHHVASFFFRRCPLIVFVGPGRRVVTVLLLFRCVKNCNFLAIIKVTS